MKQLKNKIFQEQNEVQGLEVSCGNCWGHQQYEQGYRAKKVNYWIGKRDNFISSFVKKYIG